jgi:hypothetical protein
MDPDPNPEGPKTYRTDPDPATLLASATPRDGWVVYARAQRKQ